MLLRISLFVAVLATAVTLGTSFMLSGNLSKLKTDLQQTEEAKKSAESNAAAAKTAEKKAKGEMEEAKKQLGTATNELKVASTKAAEQQKRADRLQEVSEKNMKEKIEAQQKLAAFEATGVTADQIKNLRGQIEKAVTERDALTEEKQIFSRHITQLEAKIRIYERPDQEVKLPPGLKGKILAVDPKYDFVVLDIGSNQGLLKDGKLSVSRDGKLVAKVKVISLEANRAIANVLPEWKQSDVLEGDQVMTAYEALAKP